MTECRINLKWIRVWDDFCPREGDNASEWSHITFISHLGTTQNSKSPLTPEALEGVQRILPRAPMPSSGCNISSDNMQRSPRGTQVAFNDAV